MFEGLLVDLVPYGTRCMARDYAWLNGPGAYFWKMGGRRPVTYSDVREVQQERAEEYERGGLRLLFGVQTKDGTPIGLFGVNQVTPHCGLGALTALIGEPDYWGGGYGTDALLLLVDYCFDWLDMRKVWLMTMAANLRVMHQMDKVGFRLEVRHRAATVADGARVDVLVYGLLRAEWPGRAALLAQLDGAARKDTTR